MLMLKQTSVSLLYIHTHTQTHSKGLHPIKPVRITRTLMF